MSDHDAPEHDPMDRAYVQAEAMLDDAQARAARRARVLAAVVTEPAAVLAGPSARRRAHFGRGGWLIAASVVGVSVMVALQIRSPFQAPPSAASPPPAASAPAPAGPSEPAALAAPAARTAKTEAPTAAAATPSQASPAPPPAPSVAKPVAAIAPQQTPAAPPAPPPPVAEPPPLPVPPVEHRIEEPRPPAAARAAAPSVSGTVSEMVVTTAKRRSLREDQAAQLRDAAEAGQADEVAALLAKGAPVDLPDEAGDTALMKSVRADHPAAAVLLRRRGASLDRRNLAGESARGLAAAAGDPELARALGLAP